MFERITLSLAPDRQYIAYVMGDRIEVVATIQGFTGRMATARWTGTAIADCDGPLRPDVVASLTAAIRALAARGERS